jgi:hypothetical protein
VLVILARRRHRSHRVERVTRGAGDEERLTTANDPLGDGGNLRGRLADAEDYLWKALANLAVGIDPREAEVLEGGRAQRLQNAIGREVRVERAAFDVIK